MKKPGSQARGKSRDEVLDKLDEALEGYHGEEQQPSEGGHQEAEIDSEQSKSGSIGDSDIFE